MLPGKEFNAVDNILSFELKSIPVRFHLPDHETDFVQRTIRNNGHFWELRALERAAKYIPQGGVVIDAGGYIGNHAIYFAKVCHASKVYSFEPQHRVAEILERNIELNKANQTVVFRHCALGAKKGAVRVHSRLAGTAAATAFEYSTDGNVECVTIDSLNLAQVDFIKIDVEGMEADVLIGARRTINAFNPPIWVEVVNNAALEHLEGMFSGLGYILHTWLSELDALFLPAVKSDKQSSCYNSEGTVPLLRR